jgi:hypothetical protein
VGAIEYIHKQLVAQRDAGKAVLLISLELDEVMNVSDGYLLCMKAKLSENWIRRKLQYRSWEFIWPAQSEARWRYEQDPEPFGQRWF